MLQPAVLNDGREFPYGFGWGVAEYRGRRIYHHAGGLVGYAGHMLHCRDEDLTTIVLSNLNLFPFDRVARGLVRSVFGEPLGVPIPKPVAKHMLDACAGTFRIEEGTDRVERRLVCTAKGLAFAEPGGPQLMPIGDGRFCETHDPEVEYVFSEMKSGVYGRFRYSSPLFPPTDYMRC
jgi:hypothetical protein